MEHFKKHWLKYYLTAGALWGAYNWYKYPSTHSIGPTAKAVFLWPLDFYQTVITSD